MWRFTFVDPTPVNVENGSRRRLDYASSAIRTLICLILVFLLTVILILAGVYEHVTNICLSILFTITVFFIAYSIAVKRSFDNREVNTQDQVWRTDGITVSNADEGSTKAPPPSYETVTEDPTYTSWLQLPPPYSVITSGHKKDATLKDRLGHLVLDVAKL